MKILHRPAASRVRRRWIGLVIAALLPLNATQGRADSVESKPALDAAMVAAHTAAKGDGLLEALLTELDRSKAQLKMDQVQTPYYIEYRVNELEDIGAEAAFGALRENQHMHVRVLRVVVRIGDYKQDSYSAGARASPASCRWTTIRLPCATRSGWQRMTLIRPRGRHWPKNRRR